MMQSDTVFFCLANRCCGSAPVFQRSKRHTAELPNSAAPSPVTSFDEFGTIVVPMLLALGPYAFDDVVLLYKVVRILKSALGIVRKTINRLALW